MAKYHGKQVLTRTFIQRRSRPDTAPEFLAQDDGQLITGSLSPATPGKENVIRPSDSIFGQFDTVGSTATAPETGTVSVSQDLPMSAIARLEDIRLDPREVAFHIVIGANGDVINDADTFQSKFVVDAAELSSFNYGDMQAIDADGTQRIEAEFSFRDVGRVVPVEWASTLGSTIGANITAVCFGKTRNHVYAFEAGDGAATVPIFHYSINGGTTWTSVTLTGILAASSENVVAVAAIGDWVIGVTEVATGAYIYAHSDNFAVGGWTKVTTGFVNTKVTADIYFQSSAKNFLAAAGGYIYKIDGSIGAAVTAVQDGSTTAEDLNAIHGYSRTIVAVGDSNVVLYSTNRGVTWGLLTGPIPGSDLLTVFVQSEDVWYIGASDGNAYYTVDGGTTWSSAVGFSGSGAGSVTKIVFSEKNPAFGLLAHKTATPTAVVFRTTNYGNTWEQTSLTSYPTSQEVTDMAIWDANTLVAGGIATGGTDGELAIARATEY